MRRARFSKKVADRRIRMLAICLAAIFAVALVRAAWLQTVQASDLASKSESQQRETITIPAGRGTIFDSTGVQLAIGEQATTVYADPRLVVDPRKTAAVAARILGVDGGTLATALADRSKGFVYVARQADPTKAARLKRRNLPGIRFYAEERRVYPLGPVAAQVVGYAGVDNKGLAGIELSEDKPLAGRPGKETVVEDPYGRAVDVIESTPERDGHNVVLTLDHTIQAAAEGFLSDAVAKWHAKRATAIVLNPRSGAVVAMATAPGYDANLFPKASSEYQRNAPVTDIYEPGSTFKLVTVSAVLAEHLVSPTTSYTLPYEIQVVDKLIHDAEPRGTETMTVGEILSRSSNVGAVTLARLVGATALSHWIARFGFGRETGIDFPGESPGIVPPRDEWYGSAIGTIPIGQGFAVTPLQVAEAYATVANGGVWVQPHLVDHVFGAGRPKIEKRRVLSPAIAQQVLSMLVDVVDEGTGVEAALPGYVVAGKTGTAAKPDPQTGGYSTSRYVASFVGIVPATHPKLLVLVTVDEPRGAIFGGTVAAPVFREIARFALQYLEVPPDNPATLSPDGSSTSGTTSNGN